MVFLVVIGDTDVVQGAGCVDALFAQLFLSDL